MEANLQSNFNVGFTNMRSDVLIHLTQWQYWWWFWFSLLWSFYYLMIIKMVRFRSLKFRPRLATTFRPHGKWGDLIVCIIPVSWCANIITNSNFILRMIEWQSESGFISVRIRGKQWYWVYKFELKTFTDLFTIPKNVGHNKWQISTPNDLQVADDYLHIIQLRSHNKWVKTYWDDLTKEVSKSKDFNLISPQEQLRLNFFKLDESNENKSDLRWFAEHQFELFRWYSLKRSTPFFFEYWPEDWHSVFLKNFSDINLNSFDLSEEYFNTIETEDSLLDFLEKIFYSKNATNSIKTRINTFLYEMSVWQPTEKPLVDEDSSNSEVLTSVDSSDNDSIINNTNSTTKDQSAYSDATHTDTDHILDLTTTHVKDESTHLDDKIDLSEKNSDSSKDVTLEMLEKLEILSDDQKKLFDKLYYPYKLQSLKDSWTSYTFEEYWEDLTTKPDYSLIFKNLFDISFSDFDDNSDVDSNADQFNNFIHNYLPFVVTDTDPTQLIPSDLIYPNDPYFISKKDDISNIYNFDFSEKAKLYNFNHENLFVRLFNKKLNWNESEISYSPELIDSAINVLPNSRLNQVNSINTFSEIFGIKLNDQKKIFYNYSDFSEFDRFSRKNQGTVSPIRLIKYPISNKNNFDFNSEIIELFRFRYNDGNLTTDHRLTPNSTFLIIRQKRYKRRKVILPRTIFYKDEEGNPTKKIKSSNYTFLNQNKIILENDFNATKRYKFFKKNKIRDELTNLVLSKRILRTRRTLVLPAHLNITAITNSFDVIHSWFIPGLGLKMDAIPGRATHHTFYIDNVGFYYGQCAEICGRYHHHMPIRICALPFEHFLLWWQSFGLPKLLFTKNFRRYGYSYGSRKYSW